MAPKLVLHPSFQGMKKSIFNLELFIIAIKGSRPIFSCTVFAIYYIVKILIGGYVLDKLNDEIPLLNLDRALLAFLFSKNSMYEWVDAYWLKVDITISGPTL